jgi:hypothetical protein
MAIKLRNDLFDYEDKLGSCRDFNELKKSADALVVAILEPVESRLSAGPPKKPAQMYQFPVQKRVFPNLAALGVGLQLINCRAGAPGRLPKSRLFRSLST